MQIQFKHRADSDTSPTGTRNVARTISSHGQEMPTLRGRSHLTHITGQSFASFCQQTGEKITFTHTIKILISDLKHNG